MGEHKRYDANDERHHHLVCTQCHKVSDFYDERFDALAPPPKLGGFRVQELTVQLNGLCSDCAAPPPEKTRKKHRGVARSQRQNALWRIILPGRNPPTGRCTMRTSSKLVAMALGGGRSRSRQGARRRAQARSAAQTGSAGAAGAQHAVRISARSLSADAAGGQSRLPREGGAGREAVLRRTALRRRHGGLRHLSRSARRASPISARPRSASAGRRGSATRPRCSTRSSTTRSSGTDAPPSSKIRPSCRS